MDFKDHLKDMVQRDASDLYFSTGAPVSAKINGSLTPVNETSLTAEQIRATAWSIMNDEQTREFEDKPEMNLAISEPGIGRFRVNIFKQRNTVSMVIRNIKTDIPDWELLGLPNILTDVIMEKRGLVLFVGATGSGKSTSLASLIDYRNSNSAGHIITIEDPVEFVHQHKKSIVNQREVGLDTDSYEDALKNTLRQAPDVILIGEIRDRETMEHALAFAETGHLAISTLHANNANQALDRIINFFPEDRRNQLLMDLSLNLRAFVSQRLIKTVDSKRAAAVEILLGTPLVQDMIRRGDVHEIKEVMTKSENIGMQTFDSALYKLAESGRISIDEAVKNADSPNNLRLRLNLSGDAPVEKKTEKASIGLSLIDQDSDGKTDDLDEFDAALYKLVEAGRKTAEQALSEADEPDKLRAHLETLQTERLNQAVDS
jgi:twitching motility protein PilU